ncbi:MAG: FecR family protein [Desulfobaccales bacterium]
MEKRQVIVAVVMGLALTLAGTVGAGAAVVGRLTQVEGRVNLLKGGNLPAITVKTGDPVEPGDVVRTKSLSRAQITFIDNSTLTISPESRIAIAEYLVDPAQGKRRAVLEIFQGLALAVVNKIFKVEEPDFIIKTHTAVMGVRGTEIGMRLSPNSSTIMNFKGRTQVGNIFPEVSQRFLKTFKVAYASIPWNQYPEKWVFLGDMQGTVVGRDLLPIAPYTISPQDRDLFMRSLTVLAPKPSQLGQGSEKPLISATDAGASTGTVLAAINPPGEQTTLAILNAATVPPTLLPVTGARPVFNILTSWGAGARDLDLHLTGPQGSGTFHVGYTGSGYNWGSLTTQPYALLHADDTGYSGSEVITVSKFNQGGAYQAYVYNYGDPSPTSTNLSTASGVSLKVINGGTVVPTPGGGSTVNGGTVVTTLAPTPNQAGNTWNAVSINPANGQVTAVNQITNTTNGVTSAPR